MNQLFEIQLIIQQRFNVFTQIVRLKSEFIAVIDEMKSMSRILKLIQNEEAFLLPLTVLGDFRTIDQAGINNQDYFESAKFALKAIDINEIVELAIDSSLNFLTGIMMKMQCLHWLWKWTNPKPARKEMLWKSLGGGGEK
jgi:hypothetical protein